MFHAGQLRHRGPRRGLECPVVSLVLHLCVDGGVGPRRALVDPCPQDADLLGRELLALGRHLHLFIQTCDVVDEGAVGAVAGND